MKKKFNPKIIVDTLSGIFLPIIDLITAASIMKSILILLASFNLMSAENGIILTSVAFVGQGFALFLLSMPVGFAIGFFLTFLFSGKNND